MTGPGAGLDLGDPLLAGVFFVTAEDIATLDDALAIISKAVAEKKAEEMKVAVAERHRIPQLNVSLINS